MELVRSSRRQRRLFKSASVVNRLSARRHRHSPGSGATGNGIIFFRNVAFASANWLILGKIEPLPSFLTAIALHRSFNRYSCSNSDVASTHQFGQRTRRNVNYRRLQYFRVPRCLAI